ncbi:hypothetical protein MTO96_035570, partial [Rhipicephalus appendiculatus]
TSILRRAARWFVAAPKPPVPPANIGNASKWPQIVVTVVAVCFLLFSLLFIVALGKDRRPKTASVVVFYDHRPTTDGEATGRASTSLNNAEYEPRLANFTQDPRSVNVSAGSNASTAQSVVDVTDDPSDVDGSLRERA